MSYLHMDGCQVSKPVDDAAYHNCYCSKFNIQHWMLKILKFSRPRQYNKRGRKPGYRSETTKDDNAICEVRFIKILWVVFYLT